MEENREANERQIAVSLFASSNRPKLYKSFFESLKGTSVKYEVVFAGNKEPNPFVNSQWRCDVEANEGDHRYILTENIKPSQCYEIARRACQGEVVVWVADDCEFPDDVIGKAYKHWKSKRNEKLILSIQTKESGYNLPQGALFDMNNHRFFGYDKSSPLMAPLGMMSRKFLDELGGIDRRFICGQYENSVIQLAYQYGAIVEIFGDKDCYIDIDHLKKSLLIGESKSERDFLNRPFAKGYDIDRQVLEKLWVLPSGDISPIMLDKFEPFEDKDILIKSQSNNLKEMWV